MSSKAAKIALAVAVLAVAVYLWRQAGQDRPDAALPTNFGFVCVVTGEVFDLNIDDVLSIPAKNPKTGEYTLLPCKRDERGVLRVVGQFRPALHGGDLKDVNKYVDPVTLEIKPREGS